MRVRSRLAPGRDKKKRQKNDNQHNDRALRSPKSHGTILLTVLLNYFEGAPPTGFVEKVNYHMHQKADSLADCPLQILAGRRLK